MKAPTFGLDIGTTSLKAIWLSKQGNSITLESVISAPSTSKGLMSELALDQQVLADSIKNMLSSANINIPEVNISIPESQVFSKIIEMPDLSEKEIEAALKWELERHVPLPLEQVRTDWQILDRVESNGTKIAHVLIVAAPIRILEKYDKILDYIDLMPQTVETEMISVHRALLPLLNGSGADIIVHLGVTTTDIAIIKNKVINMVFSVPLGGLAITRAISVDLGIDVVQAENMKKAYGLSQQVFEGKIGKSLTPILESIVGDIKKSMLSFKEKNNESIKQVVLSGGNALLPGIDIYFTNALGVQVVIGNVWQLHNIPNVPQEMLNDAPSYNVIMGLALRDL